MIQLQEMTPDAVYQQLCTDKQALLIDCRTQAEWLYVGVVDLREIGREVAFIEWVNKAGEPNLNFTRQNITACLLYIF